MDRATYACALASLVLLLTVVGWAGAFDAHGPESAREFVVRLAVVWSLAAAAHVLISWPRAEDAGINPWWALALPIPVLGLVVLAILLFMPSRAAAKTPEDRLAEREAALKAREDALKARAEQAEREVRLADAARRLDEREARLAELEARSADIKAS